GLSPGGAQPPRTCVERGAIRTADVIGFSQKNTATFRRRSKNKGRAIYFRFFSQRTCSTSLTPGTSSIRARSIPAFNVMVELGRLPQAPSRRNLTLPSTASTRSTSPPPRGMKGRNLSNTSCTCSFIAQAPFFKRRIFQGRRRCESFPSIFRHRTGIRSGGNGDFPTGIQYLSYRKWGLLAIGGRWQRDFVFSLCKT